MDRRFKPPTAEHRKKIADALRGRKRPSEVGRKISQARKGIKFSPETLEKMRQAKLGTKWTPEQRAKIIPKISGENAHQWVKDRSKLAKKQERNDPAYKEWRRQVWLRDNFTCKIANPDCSGQLEAHHILGWSEHPELRYEINNGITLCHAHHPRKRAEEKRLAPMFQELVSVSSN